MTFGDRMFIPSLAMASGVAAALAMTAFVAATGVGAAGLCSAGCLDRRIQALQSGSGAGRDLISRQLANSPFDASAWLRLAAIESRDGAISRNGAAALDASYRYSPVNTEVALWRTQFAFSHWGDIGATSQKAAINEVSALYGHAPEGFVSLQAAIADPAGALSYRLLVTGLGGDD